MKTEINTSEIENLHAIVLTFKGATDTAPSRISVYSERFKQRFTVTNNDGYKDAIKALIDMGYNIMGKSELANQSKYLILTDTFKPFREEK